LNHRDTEDTEKRRGITAEVAETAEKRIKEGEEQKREGAAA
jgi:hypothetical protein